MLTILPAPARQHALAGRAAQAEHGGEVHVQHRGPVVVGEFDGGRAPDGAGVVDEDVDGAQLADRRLDQRLRGRGLAHVAREHDRAAPQLADVGGGVGRHVLVAVAGDVGAGRGERARERRADSSARTRDERGEAVER